MLEVVHPFANIDITTSPCESASHFLVVLKLALKYVAVIPHKLSSTIRVISRSRKSKIKKQRGEIRACKKRRNDNKRDD
jgi:hypothetical protein